VRSGADGPARPRARPNWALNEGDGREARRRASSDFEEIQIPDGPRLGSRSWT